MTAAEVVRLNGTSPGTPPPRNFADCWAGFDDHRAVWVNECKVFEHHHETEARPAKCAFCGFIFPTLRR